MTFYRSRILPRLMNTMMTSDENSEIRARVCAGLEGKVIEIGFGSGLNLPHYPQTVHTVLAVEPLVRSVALAAARTHASHACVQHVGLTGERLDEPDDSVDAVLSTWTLCSIPHPEAALTEIKRVLKPGGVFHFVEHGLSPDKGVARNQARIEPLSKRIFGGCHLTRDIPTLLSSAGFEIDDLNTYLHPKEPAPFGWTFEGRATVPC